MSNEKYIPALKYNWLTGIYDWLIRTFMPEKKFKGAVIENANIQNGYAVLDFGVGTATLSIMASQANPNAVYKGIDIDEKILRIVSSKIKSAPLECDNSFTASRYPLFGYATFIGSKITAATSESS